MICPFSIGNFHLFSLLNDKLIANHAVKHFFIDIPLSKLT